MHDPSKIPAIDIYFMSWIDANGVDAFNDLLYLKYGKTLILDGSAPPSVSESPAPLSEEPVTIASIPVPEATVPTSTQPRATFGSALEDFKSRILQVIEQTPFREQENAILAAIASIAAGTLLVIHFLYGYLVTTNLIFLLVGGGLTWHHMLFGSKRKALSPALHVYWSLYCYLSLWESFLPLAIKERWEYSFLKSVLFAYIFLPNRMFNEDGGGTVVRIKLVTIIRDLVFFFVETCLLVYFNTNQDGRLRFREILVLVALGAVYALGTRTLKNRDRVIEELYITEKHFAAHLRTFKSSYVPALANVVTTEEMDVLTRHIEPIIALSELFCQELRMAMAKDLVAPAFEKFVPFLKMYGPFCADHETKRELVAHLRQRPEVVKVIDEVASAPPTSGAANKIQSIESYLIMPVQRIPRYVLLLAEVIKKTPPWHPDRDDCVRILSQVEEVAKSVDESIAMHAAAVASTTATTPRPVSTPRGNATPLLKLGLTRSASSASSVSAS